MGMGLGGGQVVARGRRGREGGGVRLICGGDCVRFHHTSALCAWTSSKLGSGGGKVVGVGCLSAANENKFVLYGTSWRYNLGLRFGGAI